MTIPSKQACSLNRFRRGAILIIYEACSYYWHRQNGFWSLPRPGSALAGGGGGSEVPGGRPRKSFTGRSLLFGQLRGAIIRGSEPFGAVYRRRDGDHRGSVHAL